MMSFRKVAVFPLPICILFCFSLVSFFAQGLERTSSGALVLQTRWLMNLAYMTLGEFPDKDPKQYLINPDSFKSDEDIPRFTGQ